MLLISNQYNCSTVFGTKQISRAELEALLNKDKTVEQIARKYGTASSTIRAKIKKCGLQLPADKLRERYKSEALPLIQQGVSFSKVRKLTGISEEYCYQQMLKNKTVNPRQVRNEKIRDLFYEGKSDAEIGEILSLHESSVKRSRLAQGLTR